MHLYTTDFDRHLDYLENHKGNVHFYGASTKPRTFVNTVMKDVQQLQPQEKVLLIFNEKQAHSKKAHHVMRALGERLEDRGIATLVHAFVVPPSLFKLLKAATAETLSEADFETLLENI